ncbi:MAG: UDP-N-acetylmuramoyl-L-alanyl-D-glutamate--2,6-diaminopimelate ligase [Planctomycetota bacterium]
MSLFRGDGGMEIADVTDDSRAAGPGCLFVARQDDGGRWRRYVAQAVERGAVAVVVAELMAAPDQVSLLLADQVDQALAGRVAARFFGDPAARLELVGVTGTNGKTTVATLTQHLLNAGGKKCGFIGTTAIDTGGPDGPRPAELTTPGAIELQRLFAEMVAHDCNACAMEVSSHALDQGRADGLEFAAAVFTNLTQDHLDYHGDMESYAQAKAKLFGLIAADGTAVINSDLDGSIKKTIADASPDGAAVVWTSLADTDGEGVCRARGLELAASSSRAVLDGGWGSVEARLPVVGEHNLSNVLQALAAAHAVAPLGGGLVEALERCPVVPGRLESVTIERREAPAVLVDYAHTPDALENVLTALRPLTAVPGKLIVVFGCGGDRDRTKRPKMARAATELSDRAYLTSDNPRTEDPQRILDDAYAGVAEARRGHVTVEVDRATAIRDAVLAARPGDTVLIAGKGHEDYQILGTEKIHFDDREHAAAALRAWAEANPA